MMFWKTFCTVIFLLQFITSGATKYAHVEGSECTIFQEKGRCLPAESCSAKTIVECDGVDTSGNNLICCPWRKLGPMPSWHKEDKTHFETRALTSKPGETAKNMCLKYNVATFLHLMPGAKPMQFSRCRGFAFPLIVGGMPAVPAEFPHMASLGFLVNGEIVYKCGGSLISRRFVITAAHCATSKYGLPKLVRLGAHNIRNKDVGDGTTEMDIAEVIVHPAYISSSIYNDIALLRLAKFAKFSKYIAPACLYSDTNEETFTTSVATGWGKMGYDMIESTELQKVALNIIDKELCKKLWSKIPYSKFRLPRGIPHSLLCAGALEGEKDTCQGDSGGPLQVHSKENNCTQIIGIVSAGYKCAEKNSPGVYTRISSYIDWIETIVWPPH